MRSERVLTHRRSQRLLVQAGRQCVHCLLVPGLERSHEVQQGRGDIGELVQVEVVAGVQGEQALEVGHEAAWN